jgi:hypothetical protein
MRRSSFIWPTGRWRRGPVDDRQQEPLTAIPCAGRGGAGRVGDCLQLHPASRAEGGEFPDSPERRCAGCGERPYRRNRHPDAQASIRAKNSSNTDPPRIKFPSPNLFPRCRTDRSASASPRWRRGMRGRSLGRTRAHTPLELPSWSHSGSDAGTFDTDGEGEVLSGFVTEFALQTPRYGARMGSPSKLHSVTTATSFSCHSPLWRLGRRRPPLSATRRARCSRSSRRY